MWLHKTSKPSWGAPSAPVHLSSSTRRRFKLLHWLTADKNHKNADSAEPRSGHACEIEKGEVCNLGFDLTVFTALRLHLFFIFLTPTNTLLLAVSFVAKNASMWSLPLLNSTFDVATFRMRSWRRSYNFTPVRTTLFSSPRLSLQDLRLVDWL